RECEGAGDGDDVDDVGRTRGLERGQERAQGPERAEVVRPDDELDPLGIAGQQIGAAGDSGAVDEQLHRRMAFADARRHRVDGLAVGQVAELVLAAELLGQEAQTILSARQQNAEPVPGGELARERRADAARCAGQYGYLHTRTLRLAVAVRPAPSRAVALSVC